MTSTPVTTDAALPEAPLASYDPMLDHPRPQMTRAGWEDLGGTWAFAFDDAAVGISEHWQRRDDVFDRTIQVPFPFESPASGINDTGFHPVVWYRRTIEAAPRPGGRGPVDFRAGRRPGATGAVALRRGRLPRARLGQRRGCGLPRGRPHPLHRGHHLRAARR